MALKIALPDIQSPERHSLPMNEDPMLRKSTYIVRAGRPNGTIAADPNRMSSMKFYSPQNVPIHPKQPSTFLPPLQTPTNRVYTELESPTILVRNSEMDRMNTTNTMRQGMTPSNAMSNLNPIEPVMIRGPIKPAKNIFAPTPTHRSVHSQFNLPKAHFFMGENNVNQISHPSLIVRRPNMMQNNVVSMLQKQNQAIDMLSSRLDNQQMKLIEYQKKELEDRLKTIENENRLKLQDQERSQLEKLDKLKRIELDREKWMQKREMHRNQRRDSTKMVDILIGKMLVDQLTPKHSRNNSSSSGSEDEGYLSSKYSKKHHRHHHHHHHHDDHGHHHHHGHERDDHHRLTYPESPRIYDKLPKIKKSRRRRDEESDEDDEDDSEEEEEVIVVRTPKSKGKKNTGKTTARTLRDEDDDDDEDDRKGGHKQHKSKFSKAVEDEDARGGDETPSKRKTVAAGALASSGKKKETSKFKMGTTIKKEEKVHDKK